jgi:hypothetical protein
MQKSVKDLPAKHTLLDWLALHELDHQLCCRIFEAIAQESATDLFCSVPVFKREAVSSETDWIRAADALRSFFPSHHVIIGDTLEKSGRTIIKRRHKSRMALTLDNGPTEFPTIFYSHHGRPCDTLTIAHEFAHAVQIRASKGKFVTPIIREVCAFIGEQALLISTKEVAPPEYELLNYVWHDDNRKFFGPCRDLIASALSRPYMPYSYSWNYPIARYLAIRTFQLCSRDQMWKVFEGDVSVQEALGWVGF